MRFRFSVLATALALLAAVPASADTLEFKARFDHWSVYSYQHGKSKICYAATRPLRWEPAAASRAHAYLHVTTHPGDGVRDEVSATFGAALDQSFPPVVTIKKQEFGLMVAGQNAFARDAATQKALLRAMRSGKIMSLQLRSRAGDVLEYGYSLKGIADALKHVEKVCK